MRRNYEPARIDFPRYPDREAAAARGCFMNCGTPLKLAPVVDAGFPPGRGQYAIRCPSCGVSTYFDLTR